ncbi:hypothetical protein [Variovorax ginsengisoli]|uniref:Uncharacterized protein n=1 Tax=Variovorax ginsengisoli TaxID=363844 RepID=A0ABT8SBF6_9BURK|nr:hypothetical protein [Variovorax ginsengisoli]MDN8616983.1 hypothetical protein [Variovorax ginsengisoli]MDO1536153.1 hypothetical protein [Variovorax ginsengisoli]
MAARPPLPTHRALRLLLIAAYGAMGLDGLALCSEHSVAANATIGAEAASGVALRNADAADR